jgi:hypothetical protein
MTRALKLRMDCAKSTKSHAVPSNLLIEGTKDLKVKCWHRRREVVAHGTGSLIKATFRPIFKSLLIMSDY